MESLTIGRRGDRIVLVNNTTKVGLAFSWRSADAIGHVLAYKARGIIAPENEDVMEVTVRREGPDIVITRRFTGDVFAVMPPEVALEIGNGLIGKARLAEEEEKHEQVAFDHALLQRRGIYLGLTNNPHIQHEAGIEAAHNTKLRRYLASTNLRQTQVGVPDVDKEKINERFNREP